MHTISKYLIPAIISFFMIGLIIQTQTVQALDETDLIASWTFEDGTAQDTSGHNHDGTIHGTQMIAGTKGNALHFNGVDNYINIPNSPEFNGLTQLTVACWFKVNGFDIWEPILNKGGYNEYTTDVFEVNINSGGFVHFVLNFQTSGRQGYNTPTGQITPGTWYHLVGSWDGDILNLYLNGELVQTYDTPNEPLKTSDDSLQIGLEYDNPDQSFFNGDIDDIYIYSRAITSKESNEIYTSTGSGTTSSFSTLKYNKAIERSPLHGLIPKETIPLLATGTTLLILLLWNLFGGILLEFISDYTSEHIIDAKGKKQTFTEKLDHIRLPYLPMKTSELLNLLFATIVFSLAMSWTWASTVNEILGLFLLNIIAVGIIFMVRELFRINYSKKHTIQTQHIFWPFGALLTLASTFLGNTFSLASYVKGENEQEDTYPAMLFQSSLILFAISIATFAITFISGNVIFQMISVFTIMMLIIDMTPLKPMDGALIRKWNMNKWLSLYILIGISYIIMNFHLY